MPHQESDRDPCPGWQGAPYSQVSNKASTHAVIWNEDVPTVTEKVHRCLATLCATAVGPMPGIGSTKPTTFLWATSPQCPTPWPQLVVCCGFGPKLAAKKYQPCGFKRAVNFRGFKAGIQVLTRHAFIILRPRVLEHQMLRRQPTHAVSQQN